LPGEHDPLLQQLANTLIDLARLYLHLDQKITLGSIDEDEVDVAALAGAVRDPRVLSAEPQACL
jgi:hypothetical protein